MQRAFSFDRDDTTTKTKTKTPSSATAYRPLPVPGPAAVPLAVPLAAVPLAAAPPRPPIHHHYDERLPLRDQYDGNYNDDYDDEYRQHHHQYHPRRSTHARHASTSSLTSSDSSVSSVARGGLGAPSPRSFQQHHMYNTQQQQQQQHGDPQWGAGSARIDGPGYPGQDDRYDRVAPAGASERYFAMRQHSSPANSSPMSQAHVPLMGGGGGGGSGTPASRFADPMPSPPPPPHHDAPPPSPPPHRDLHNRRVLNDPVGGHYTDNPYTRYSTTWDPQLVARQLQAADSETLVFSDDEDDARGRRHAGAMATTTTTTTTTTAAGAAAGAALVGRPANHAAPTVERGGLLGSEGGSTMRLNGQSLYMWSAKCGRERGQR